MAIAGILYGLDCQKCNENEKIERGCDQDSPIKNVWKIGKYSTLRCPLKQVTKQSKDYLDAYYLFKIGYLPNGQGWIGESKKFLDAMKIIDTELKEAEKNGKRK